MVLSMTGFGRTNITAENYSVTVEVKSVNHRFCEINLRMPRQFMVIEDKIKKVINKYVHRGRIELYLTVEGEGLVKRSLKVDWELVDQYFQTVNRIKDKYSLDDTFSLTQLFTIDHITSVVEEEHANDELESLLLDAVRRAMKQLKSMRETEGQELYLDINNYLTEIEANTKQIAVSAPNVIKQYHDRISKKVNEYVTGIVDDDKIITDVALFAEKVDISEELTRMNSHITQFVHTLETSGSIGRKLDFILQEMNRETNTIGSKANDSTIAKHVVEIKSLLEKIKEQVQNIE